MLSDVTLRRLGVVLAALLLGLLAAFPAMAQYPPAGDGVVCDTSAVDAGGTLTCTIDVCDPGSPVEGTAVFDTASNNPETVVVETTADSNGEATLEFDVPNNANGSVDVSIECLVDGQTQVFDNENVATVTPGKSGGTPGGGQGKPVGQRPGTGALGVTGGPLEMLALGGAVLLAAGAGFLLFSGRRRTA